MKKLLLVAAAVLALAGTANAYEGEGAYELHKITCEGLIYLNPEKQVVVGTEPGEPACIVDKNGQIGMAEKILKVCPDNTMCVVKGEAYRIGNNPYSLDLLELLTSVKRCLETFEERNRPFTCKRIQK